MCQVLDPRSGWGTLIPAVKLLVESDDDRLFFIFNGGIHMCFQVSEMMVRTSADPLVRVRMFYTSVCREPESKFRNYFLLHGSVVESVKNI